MAKKKVPSERGTNVKLCTAWVYNTLFLNKSVTLPPARHSSDSWYFGAGTPNMKLLYSLVWAVYELLTGGKIQIHCNRLINYMLTERKCHGHGEVLSPSHIQLWLTGYAVALYIADRPDLYSIVSRKSADNLRESMSTLRSLALEWLQVEYALYTICEVERTSEERKKDPKVLTEVYTCGGRSFKGRGDQRQLIAINPARDKFLYAVRTGLLASKANKYDLSSLAVTRLSTPTRMQIQVAPKEYPPMWGKLTAERFDNEYFYIKFDDVRPTKDFAQSAGYDENGRWIEIDVDQERIDRYKTHGTPVLSANAERSIIPDIEAGRRK